MTDTAQDQSAAPKCPVSVEDRAKAWSLYQPWLQQDPVSHWEELREAGPIFRSDEAGGFWILTRYEDIEWAARTPEIFSSAELAIPHRQIFPEKQIPIQLDGEEHRKWRQTLSSLFNPGVVNHFTPQIRQAAADAIEAIQGRSSCEFVSEFAVALPAETFLINFGIGREYLKPLLDHKTWLRREGIPNARTDAELREANQPLWKFFSDAIDRRRAEGTEGRRDVISQMLRTTYDGRLPTQDEMVNALFVSMLASLDSTTAALSMVFDYLSRHPETQKLVVAEPEKIPAIVQELIRHEPVSSTGRLVTQDVERHGVTMRKGDRVLLSWGMSGLDPDVFENPHEVNFERETTRQLAFGVGPHRCLGMHVARRIIQIALEEWHTRLPAYRQAPDSRPIRHYSPTRGLLNLDLVFDEAAPTA
ncbi:cytochrome P450 [Streptomyces sp. NPDC059002]|uniref:cytochrome P450 n=1 Tax=Streptomyces sp. NPDC059002 TaxID=3346690 RepID=UPI00369C5F25